VSVGLDGASDVYTKVLVSVTYSSGSSEPYSVLISKADMAKMNNNGHYDFVIYGPNAQQFGGGSSNSGILNIQISKDKQKLITADLAIGSTVYSLKCKPSAIK
jgi:hypothetical protein